MALGTIGAIVGAGASILGNRAQNRATNRASDIAAQTARENNALQERIYNSNSQNLAPFMDRGNQAGDAINALLGLESRGAVLPQQNASGAGSVDGFNRIGEFGDYQSGDFGGNTRLGGPNGWRVQNRGDYTGAGAGAPAPAGQDYNKAFANYRNSTGYQFRVGEGTKALDASASARGVRNSGAAAKSLERYRQGTASGEFGNYLGQLSNQQGVGLSGASALAGVGQNYASQVGQNNNNASTVAANAALARGQNSANLYNNLAGAVGFGSSFLGG